MRKGRERIEKKQQGGKEVREGYWLTGAKYLNL